MSDKSTAEHDPMSDLERARQREDAMMRAFAMIGDSAAQLAHEIKNPITAVNVALRAVADQLGEDHQAVLEDLVVRMQGIEQMMRRTLSFVTPIDLRASACSARELFDATLVPLRSEIARAGARVDVRIAPGDVRFRGDPALLKEVLMNLITNAIEAEPNGVHIALLAEHAADGAVLLAVEDDGPGVPDSLRGSLFKPFVSTKRKGHGLGLTICRRIVEEHGGTLELSGETRKGARFELRIPARARNA